MTAPLAYGAILSLPSSSLPRTSVCQMKKMPMPVTAMRTWSVATGQTKATTCSPWWATLWAWATSGGFPTSPTRMAEVPVFEWQCRVGTPCYPEERGGPAPRASPEVGHVLSKLDVSITLGTGIVPADGNGKSRRHLYGSQLRRQIVLSFNCKLPPENSRTLVIYS